jgi:hypothetical protein
MRNSATFVLMLTVFYLPLQSSYGVEEEVIADIGGQPITNIEVFESAALELERGNPLNNFASGPFVYQGRIEDMLPVILFEQYAAQNGIKITEQEVTDLLTEEANKHGRTLTEDIQHSKTEFEDFDNARKRAYKQQYGNLLTRTVIEHYNPDVNTVTEEDIQKWIKYRKTFHAPMGEPERIQYRGISVFASDYENNSVQDELGKIRKRINEGESFEVVSSDYSGRDEYHARGIGHQPTDWVMTSIFEKQGFDALAPWSLLKGKVVLVKVKELPYVMVVKVVDHQPDTQMSIEDAINDKNLRQVCINQAREYKFRIQKRDLVEKLKTKMGGIRYRGEREEIFQRMADQYKVFQAETRGIDPNSTQDEN